MFGAGPVGLLAAYSALIKGAAIVYVVDKAASRLKKAEEIGAIPIDFSKGDPVQQIKDHVASNKNYQASLRPGESDKMSGVNCAIDAVGYQARAAEGGKEDPMQTVKWSTQLLNPGGSLSLIGVYFPADPGGATDAQKKGLYEMPLGDLWSKSISVGQGQAPVKKYNLYLRDLIVAGRAKPSFIVSQRLPLSQAPEAYEHFDKRGEGTGQDWTKVILKPGQESKAA